MQAFQELMQTINTMRSVRQRSVLVATIYATFLLLFLRIVDSWDIGHVGRQTYCRRIYRWRNDHAYSRRPYHCCNLCRHGNPNTFSSPLRRRNSLQLGLFSFGNNNDIERRNNDTSHMATADTPQHPITTNNAPTHCLNRRNLLLSSILMITSTSTLSLPKPAMARGLVHFPCVRSLANSYHFLRVGATLLEEDGILSTNPLFLTNRDDALSPRGIEQVVEACRQIQLDEKRLPTLVKYSLAASCIDTAMIVGQELKLGTDRIIPEFTFLDPRGIGDWDMSSRDITMPALWAMDNDEAGTDGLYALPPSSDDGTPHEVLADQAVRLRQILSILESQYSGDTILLVFPDGTGPALLSAMIAGIPYNRVHELEYHPGEIRFDVTMESTLELWKEKLSVEGQAYNETIKQGRLALKGLRATHDSGGTVTNLKDKRIEEERIGIENEYRKKQQQRIEAELQREALRSERQYELVETRRSANKPDIGTETAIGMSAIVGAGTAAWYFSSNYTRASSTINATDSDNRQRHPSTDQRTLERYNISKSNGGLYAEMEVGSSNRSEISQEGSLGNQYIYAGTVKPAIEPKEKARIAMEEYLNRDDGADDWLLSITQIINEENIDGNELPGFDNGIANPTVKNETINSLSANEEHFSERNDLPVVHSSKSSDQPFQ